MCLDWHFYLCFFLCRLDDENFSFWRYSIGYQMDIFVFQLRSVYRGIYYLYYYYFLTNSYLFEIIIHFKVLRKVLLLPLYQLCVLNRRKTFTIILFKATKLILWFYKCILVGFLIFLSCMWCLWQLKTLTLRILCIIFFYSLCFSYL